MKVFEVQTKVLLCLINSKVIPEVFAVYIFGAVQSLPMRDCASSELCLSLQYEAQRPWTMVDRQKYPDV